MPARVPTLIKKRIVKLAEEGFTQVEIARELNINRRTVAHYIDGVDGPTAKPSPATTLTPELLAKLQFLAKNVGSGTCPTCSAAMHFHLGQPSVKCPQCKDVWSVVATRQVDRPAAAPSAQLHRSPQPAPATGIRRVS